MDYECQYYDKPLTLLTSGQPVNICAPMVRYSRYYVIIIFGMTSHTAAVWLVWKLATWRSCA